MAFDIARGLNWLHNQGYIVFSEKRISMWFCIFYFCLGIIHRDLKPENILVQFIIVRH